ncbi:MAG: hypothetical protein QXQ79_02130 [Candidatus Nanoarchaeia archaeon]
MDAYVSNLIKELGKQFRIEIDPKNPSLEDKLKLIGALDETENYELQWYAMEIAVGRRIDAQEQELPFLFATYLLTKTKKQDLSFYKNLAEHYGQNSSL